jgi:hypothetical protein
MKILAHESNKFRVLPAESLTHEDSYLGEQGIVYATGLEAFGSSPDHIPRLVPYSPPPGQPPVHPWANARLIHHTLTLLIRG